MLGAGGAGGPGGGAGGAGGPGAGGGAGGDGVHTLHARHTRVMHAASRQPCLAGRPRLQAAACVRGNNRMLPHSVVAVGNALESRRLTRPKFTVSPGYTWVARSKSKFEAAA